MADSVVKNANKEKYDEDAIFDRLLDETLEPDVVDLREEQYEGMAPPHLTSMSMILLTRLRQSYRWNQKAFVQ